jgi:hypothetical protein
MKDFENASKEMLAASSMERAPSWLAALGIRLLSETGAVAQALTQSLEMYNAIKDESGKKRLEERIRSLRFTFEQNAWKDALEKYRSIYHREPENLEELRPFRAEAERGLASILGEATVSPRIAKILSERFAFHYDEKKRDIASLTSTEQIQKTGIFVPSEQK